MDFEFSEAQKMLQDTVRRFVNNELMPLESSIMARERWNCGRRDMIGRDVRIGLEKKAKDIGLHALFVPKEYGGAGLGTLEYCMVNAEMHRTLTPFLFAGDAPSVLLAGNDELKKNYYLPHVRGEKHYAFAQTEANAGSDAAAVQTTAVKTPKGWLINGTKMFITDGDCVDYILAVCVTDKTKGAHGISMIVVDNGDAKKDTRTGYKVSRLIPTMAEWCVTELLMEDTLVPLSNIIGQPGDGFMLAQKYLAIGGRLDHAARDLGIAERCFKMAADYAQKRYTFGQPLSNRQAIQWMMAESALEMYNCRWIMYHCASEHDKGKDIRVNAALVKIQADEMVGKIIDRAIQIHGGIACTTDMPLERFYRRARIWRLGGGSMEMMRMLVARNVFKGFMP